MEGSNIKPKESKVTDNISNTLYVNFRSIDPHNLFIYITGVLFAIAIARYLKLDIYLVLIFAIAVTFIYISKTYVYNTVKRDNIIDKLNDIYPHPLYFDTYPDLIILFYGLKRMSELNIGAYANAIYNTDAVIRLYKDSLIGTQNCKYNYDVARDRAKNALNALHDLVYSIETSKAVMTKYHTALQTLQEILNSFLDKIKYICESDTSWDHTKSIIERGPEPYNSGNPYDYF
jgi:hypothetical protein